MKSNLEKKDDDTNKDASNKDLNSAKSKHLKVLKQPMDYQFDFLGDYSLPPPPPAIASGSFLNDDPLYSKMSSYPFLSMGPRSSMGSAYPPMDNYPYYGANYGMPPAPAPAGPKGKNLPYDPVLHGVLTRLAETKARDTFGSIELLIDAFSSISMILESTYTTVNNSFRSVAGLADHLIFVRNHLAEIALFPRAIQTIAEFFKWLLQLVGLGRLFFGDGTEAAWNESSLGAGGSSNQTKIKNFLMSNDSSQDKSRGLSVLPISMFFALIFGTPYLMWRLLGLQKMPKENYPEWSLTNGVHYNAVALHQFKGRNQNELTFQKQQKLFIKPESVKPGARWFVAATNTNPPKIGYVGPQYVKIQF